MIHSDIVKSFQVGRDAFATNRGFLYQYLVTLKKWISNFITDTDTTITPEADDDIQELGSELIFTQVKCYTSSMSFSSPEVRTGIVNFYILHLKYAGQVANPKFVFLSTSGIKPIEKTLIAWHSDPDLKDESLKNKCTQRVREIVKEELKKKRDVVFTKFAKSDPQRSEMASAYQKGLEHIGSPDFEHFVKQIGWQFINSNPEAEILKLQHEVIRLISNERFSGHPQTLLLNRLLSEIYRCSSKPNKSDRILTNQALAQILKSSATEIGQLADKRLMTLLNANALIVEGLRAEIQRLSIDVENIKQQTPPPHICPKELTFIPKFAFVHIIGRSREVVKLNELSRDNSIVVLHGEGGLGKSAIAIQFVKNSYDLYSHILWLPSSSGLIEALTLNEALTQNLNLKFNKNTTTEERARKITNKLKSLPGKKLIVIDDLIGIKTSSVEPLLDSLNDANIDIVATSRERTRLPSINVAPLERDDLREIYVTNCPRSDDSEEAIDLFLEAVGHNTLMVELVAKTIDASLDLTLRKVQDHFKQHRLDDTSLRIKIESQGGVPIELFEQLLTTFSLANLEQHDRYVLEYLSVLPDGDIVIEDFIRVWGADFFEQNKAPIINQLNSLHKAGWVTRDGSIVRVHPLVSQAVRYQIPNYVGFSFFITYLTHRLDETNRELTADERYLLMGQSLVDKIPSQLRQGIEQPMIILENNVLMAYRRLGKLDKFTQPMIELMERAVKIVDPTGRDMVVIYHNAAVAFESLGKFKVAKQFMQKGIDIARKDAANCYPYLIQSLDNFVAFKLSEGDTDGALQLLEESFDLRKKYLDPNDPMFMRSFNDIGLYFIAIGNYKQAIATFKIIIQLAGDDNINSKNDKLQAMYLTHIASAYFADGQHELAISANLRAIALYEKGGLRKNVDLINCYQVVSVMYAKMGLIQEADEFRKKAQA
jgi:tetratricopeptide (TPR) repeat protein